MGGNTVPWQYTFKTYCLFLIVFRYFFSISAHSENSVEAANTDETITLHYFVGDGADTNSLAMYDEHNSIIYPDPNTNDNKNGKFFRLFFSEIFWLTKSTFLYFTMN